MIKFKNEGIQLALSELQGTDDLIELVAENKKDPLTDDYEVLISKFTQIANESKLILDPDLDSYYTMALLTQHLPRLLSKLVSLNKDSITADQKRLYLSQIHEEQMNIYKATAIISAEDKNFYGTQATFIIQDTDEFELQLSNHIESIMSENSKKIENYAYLYSYRAKLNHYLREMLQSRIQQIIKDRNEAIYKTSIIWILSIILAIALVRQLIKMQKKLDQQLKEKTATLISTSKFSALGEMSGALAHEVNTPLATILLRTEQIISSIGSNKPNKDEVILESISAIRSTINKIAKIIQGLKTFSRQSDNDPMTENSILSLIDDALALCGEKLKKQGIEVKTVIKTENPENLNFYCRPSEIVQVLINLICNSSDAILEIKNPWVQIMVEDLNTDIKVSVIDSGPGIPTHIQKKMMTPFFTTKDVGKGTGLGLSISKGIITNHKGKLFVDTAHSNTCICFQIPKALKTG